MTKYEATVLAGAINEAMAVWRRSSGLDHILQMPNQMLT
jgi:hypothetical protein